MDEHPTDLTSSVADAVVIVYPVIDLPNIVARLQKEVIASGSGYRSEIVLRSAPATLMLFVFEGQGNLREHKAGGIVTLHVLSGILMVNLEGNAREIRANQILEIPAGVPHSVQASEASWMLLTLYSGSVS